MDWWSLGALMYDMLTGAPPFTAENRWETHASISSVNTTIDVKTLKEVIFTLSFKKMLPEVPVIFFKNKCEQTKIFPIDLSKIEVQ